MAGQVVNVVIVVHGTVSSWIIAHAFLVLRERQHLALVGYRLHIVLICVRGLEQATLEVNKRNQGKKSNQKRKK